MPLPRYKAILFDYDDTLVSSFAIKAAHHKTVAKQFYGITLTNDEIKTHWGKPFDELISQLYQKSDSVENMRAANRSLHQDYPKILQKDTKNVLAALINQGIALGIITAANREYVIADLAQFTIPLENFALIQGAEDTNVHKPNPAVFTLALQKLHTIGINRKSVCYVGDALTDFYAVRDAGLDFIGITSGLSSYNDFVEAGATQIISALPELLSYITEQ